MSTCDQDGLIQFWNISSSIPTPLWTYSDGVNIPICSSVNRDYVIIGTMLGKLLGMTSKNFVGSRIFRNTSPKMVGPYDLWAIKLWPIKRVHNKDMGQISHEHFQ